MNRKSFIGSFIGLIGIASNIGEISSIGLKKSLLVGIPNKTKVGDILLKKTGEQFYFTGKKIVNIISGDSFEIEFSENSDYCTFSSAALEC